MSLAQCLQSAGRGAAHPVVVPLALTPLQARIAHQHGFQFGYVSGGALGYEYGVSEALLTLTEVAEVSRRVVQHGQLGVIVDVGVGFGDPVHVARMMWEIEATGADAIEIEDQVAPKRVSHHRGIEHLVSCELMVQKIQQAVAARRDPGCLIIARTGAIKNESFDDALNRLHAYQDAGADVLMMMPENAEQIAAARSALQGPLATITAMDTAADPMWRDSGWNLIIDPFTTQVLSVMATQNAYANFGEQGAVGVSLRELFDVYNGLDELAGLRPLYEIEDVTTERNRT